MPVIGGRILRVAMREGNPARPPLLLMRNGFGASLEMLQPFVDALDPQRAIIRFDMPGLGGSPAPVLPYHLATTARLLSGILDQLGYQQADVLGISWGGGLAQQFALRCPARVRRLVLVATASGALMVPGSPRILLRMLTPQHHQDPGYAARLAGELFGGRTREDPSPARDLLHAVTRPGPARGSVYQLLSLAGWTSLPRLRRPALILAGDDDPIIPLANARINAPADAAQRASHLSRRPLRPGPGSRTDGCDRGGVPHRRESIRNREPLTTSRTGRAGVTPPTPVRADRGGRTRRGRAARQLTASREDPRRAPAPNVPSVRIRSQTLPTVRPRRSTVI